MKRGHLDYDPTEELSERLRKQYPRLYGKVQAKHKARFLNTDEVGLLLAACQDGTWLGSRDQLAIRLGLLGVRSTECRALTWGDLGDDGRLHWVGKGRRQRTVTPGPTLTLMLARWRREYERRLDRPLTPSDPLICRQSKGNRRWGTLPGIVWGEAMRPSSFIFLTLVRAEAAGIGHVAPHDLRRSAANILHNTRTADGGHVYDLLDIQQVLDHADPATTQRSYLSQMCSEVKSSAGRTLDF